MTALKPGTRLGSVTCETEVVVVKAPGEPVDLWCGGKPMVEPDSDGRGGASPAAPFDDGTLVGKRYESADSALEVLCTKPGAGSLSIGETPLQEKSAKPLPASD